MTEYVTTNIRLPKAMHERIKRFALEENKSMAQVVRESLVQYVTWQTEDDPSRTAEYQDPILALGSLTRPEEVIGGDRPTDTSVRHDYYLYEVGRTDAPVINGEHE